MYISKNPFRVIGIPSNSSQKTIQKNLSKLKAFSKIGKSKEFDFDLSFLNLATVDRSFDIISKVESRILLDENKLKYSLFWFQDVSSYDSIALAKLIKGETDKALEIWSKTMKSGEVNSKNFSAFNNISSLLLLLQLDKSKTDQFKNDKTSIAKLKQALEQKVKLIKSDFFVDYCLSVGVKSDINSATIQTFFAEKILETLNQNFTNKELGNLVKGLDESFLELINSSLIREPVSNIKEQVNITALALKNNVKEGLFIGKSLIKNTVNDLKYLKDILGVNHYHYESLADKLSNQILQCGIVYFNKMNDDQSYLSSYKYALSIAVNEKTKTRAKDCIKHCEEERLANICCNCNTAKVDKSNVKNTIMYKETERSWLSNQVKYNQVTLSFYFCKDCNIKIDKASTTNLLIAGVGGLIIAALIYANDGGFVAIIGAIIGFSIISWISSLINSVESDAIEKQPIVKKHKRDGYSFTQPGK